VLFVHGHFFKYVLLKCSDIFCVGILIGQNHVIVSLLVDCFMLISSLTVKVRCSS
jgi:hypothetical protein